MTSSATPPRNPAPAYQALSQDSPLHVNLPLYRRIANAESRRLTYSHTLPIRSGHAFHVPAGHLCRLITPDGPQVGDLNLWNADNPRERFWAARTRQLQASHVSVGDRLWSCLPYLRPMATVVGDSLKEYGVDGVGGRAHDLLGTRCDPYVNQMLTGESFDFHCHSNLTRAIAPYGLTEFDVHDVLNVFQVTGLNRDGKYFMEPSPAVPGSYFEFLAEIPLLCALSTCPGGDLSAWGWQKGEGKDSMVDCCRPIRVEVYEITDARALEGWKSPGIAAYRGGHGVGEPVWGQ